MEASENETIFRDYVVRRELPRNADPVENPVIILVGGQPGAGKTSLVTSGVRDLSATGATVQIVGDNLRSYHPQFEAFQNTDAENASQLTHNDASRWADKLLIEAASRRLNIVFEHTMRSPEAVSFLAQQFRVAGYRVETRVVAVNERESWQGCLNRFEQMHREGNAARIPPKEHHDNAVIGLVNTIRHLEAQQLADAVEVRLRNGVIIFGNELVEGAWLKPEGAAAALLEERKRARTPDELELHSSRWQNVRLSMENRNADTQAIETIHAIAVDDMAYFRAQIADGPKQVIAHIEQTTELKREPLMAAQHLPDLTPDEIAERAMASPFLQNRKAEIERLSQIVFGDPAAMSTRIQAIDTNPVLASATAEIVRYWPEEIAPLPGKPAGWIRSSSPERQQAEAYVPILADAIKDYGHALSYERRRIAEIHDIEQRRLSQDVPAPSPELSAALRFPAEDRLAQFQACAGLRSSTLSRLIYAASHLASACLPARPAPRPWSPPSVNGFRHSVARYPPNPVWEKSSPISITNGKACKPS
ncbi:zeta toxin [Ochrobactrum sp. BH3]|nr:zeta toxin [Ochrobactrum sp. BH3]